MAVLIPAYEPDQRMLQLIASLQAMAAMPIVIVDDGSGPGYARLFLAASKAGCTILAHPRNLGKGRALKTGFAYLLKKGYDGPIICADSDGQHLPDDIMRVAEAVRLQGGQLVLGVRHFTGQVPLRSMVGNQSTRLLFRFISGIRVHDTQTGLRGFPAAMLPWLVGIAGERFEYEMNMLLEAARNGYAIAEVPIETVYLERNKSSHFRPLHDSVRVYMPIIRFSAVSIASAALDWLLLLLIQAWTSHLLAAVIGARIGSSLFNYTANRAYVFSPGGKRAPARRSLPKYYALAALLMLLNYGLLHLLHEQLGLPLLAAKAMAETALFLLSYTAQQRLVYAAQGVDCKR